MSEEQVKTEQKPYEPKMVFLTTFDGHVIYDVEYRKLWVKDNYRGEVCKSLCEINENDRYVNIPIIERPFAEDIDPTFGEFTNIYKTIIMGKNDFLISHFPQYFSGDSIYNFCINMDYLRKLNYRTRECIILNTKEFYSHFKPVEETGPKVKIYSFNLIHQIQVLAFDHDFEIDVMIENNTDEPYWYFTKLENKTMKFFNNISKHVKPKKEVNRFDTEEVYDFIFDKAEVPTQKPNSNYPTGYRRIKYIVKNIVDKNRTTLIDIDDDMYGHGTYIKREFKELY